MRKRSETWASIVECGRFDTETIAVIAGKEYTKITAPVINRAAFADTLSVGNCISATLEISVLTDDLIPRSAPVIIRSRVKNDKSCSEWKDFGTFYIDSRETSYDGVLTLNCFDSMLKANQQYADPSISDDRIGWPKTMKAVVAEAAFKIGVELDSRTVIHEGDSYQVPYPDKLTIMQVLGYIAGTHGGNWVITEENKLRLVPLIAPLELPSEESFFVLDDSGNRIITNEGHRLVWKHRSAAETPDELDKNAVEVTVVTGSISSEPEKKISRITIACDSDLGYSVGNDEGIELRIEDNPYACQKICDELYGMLGGMSYVAYDLKGVCDIDPCIEVNDLIFVGDEISGVVNHLSLTFDTLFSADISSPKICDMESEYPFLSEIKKLKQINDERLEKYTTATKNEIHSQILQTRKEILLEVAGTYATGEKVDSALKLTSESIAAEVSRATGEENTLKSSIELTAESIKSEVARAKGEEDGLKSSVSQTAKSISLEIERAKAAEDQLKTSISQTAESITTMVSKNDFGSYAAQYYNSFIFGFNHDSKYVQINPGSISIYDNGIEDSKLRTLYNQDGNHFYREGCYVGKIGTNFWIGNSSHKGLVFDLDDGKYMAWADKSATDSSKYTTVLCYSRADSIYDQAGLHTGVNFYMHNHQLHNADLRNSRANGYNVVQGGSIPIVTSIEKTENGGIRWNYSSIIVRNGMITAMPAGSTTFDE